jgi:hypothetical protein
MGRMRGNPSVRPCLKSARGRRLNRSLRLRAIARTFLHRRGPRDRPGHPANARP